MAWSGPKVLVQYEFVPGRGLAPKNTTTCTAGLNDIFCDKLTLRVIDDRFNVEKINVCSLALAGGVFLASKDHPSVFYFWPC